LVFRSSSCPSIAFVCFFYHFVSMSSALLSHFCCKPDSSSVFANRHSLFKAASRFLVVPWQDSRSSDLSSSYAFRHFTFSDLANFVFASAPSSFRLAVSLSIAFACFLAREALSAPASSVHFSSNSEVSCAFSRLHRLAIKALSSSLAPPCSLVKVAVCCLTVFSCSPFNSVSRAAVSFEHFCSRACYCSTFSLLHLLFRVFSCSLS